MPIRNETDVQYPSFVNGVDNTTAIGSKELAGTISVGDNTDLVEDDLAKKRAGYTPVTTWSNYIGRGGLEYVGTSGVRRILVYGEQSVLTGSTGILGYFTGSSAPTTLQTGLRDGIKPSFVQFKNLAFLFNGFDNLLIEDTTVRRIGIPAPASAPTLTTTISGDKVPSGGYFFAYSYYNSRTGAESTLSPASSTFVAGATASSAGFRLGIIAGDSSLADQIRIYSSYSGGSVLFLEDTIPVSSTSYDAIAADASLIREAELDNSLLPEPAKYAIIADNRIFVAGFASNPNRVMYSKQGIDGPMPESYQAADFIDCNINDGDIIVGLSKAGDNVIVIKERSVGRLIRVQSETGGLERQGSIKYLYEEISSEVTGVSHHLAFSLDNISIWLGRDDLYGTDGGQIFRFGKRILKTIRNLDFTQTHKWSCTINTSTKQFLIAVTKPGARECDYQIVGHYRNFPNLAFTFYTSGSDTSTHPGLIVGSFIPVTINRIRKMYFITASGDGRIHQMNTGDSDNGFGIYWRMKMPWDGGENKAAKKHFHSYYLLAAGSGVPPNNTITQTFEINTNERTIYTAVSTLLSTSPLWHSVDWHDFLWASVTFDPIKFFPNKKAYFGRYGFYNTYANQPVAVRAVTGVRQPVPTH